MNKKKFLDEKRTTIRNIIIRKIGLDSDVAIALISGNEQFLMYKPRIYNSKNTLHINYIVFSELMGYFIHNLKYSQEHAKNKIFSFLRENNIKLIKKSETDLNRVNLILNTLKKQRDKLKNNAGNRDLAIIAIYKSHEIDCIMSRNSLHFEPFCKYLKIEFEKLKENIDIMWKEVFWRRKKRY